MYRHRNTMTYIIILFSALSLFLLTVMTLCKASQVCNKKTPMSFKDDKPPTNHLSVGSCLLCGRTMIKGEKMVSKQLERRDDSIVYLYGCRECAHTAVEKHCPVCKRRITGNGYLIGRMWHREKTGRNHLHIAGCTWCGKIRMQDTCS